MSHVTSHTQLPHTHNCHMSWYIYCRHTQLLIHFTSHTPLVYFTSHMVVTCSRHIWLSHFHVRCSRHIWLSRVHVTHGCHMFTSHMVVTCYDMFRQLQTTVYCTLQCFSLCLAISDRLEQTLSHMTQVKDIGPK